VKMWMQVMPHKLVNTVCLLSLAWVPQLSWEDAVAAADFLCNKAHMLGEMITNIGAQFILKYTKNKLCTELALFTRCIWRITRFSARISSVTRHTRRVFWIKGKHIWCSLHLFP